MNGKVMLVDHFLNSTDSIVNVDPWLAFVLLYCIFTPSCVVAKVQVVLGLM
jgi:hypothetical protein